jgi:nucleotide-binding universal stress UspA family protein
MFQKRLGSEIVLLYASEPYMPFDMFEAPAAWSLQHSPELRARVEKELNQYASKHLGAPSGLVHTVVVEDTPAKAIAETATRLDADLILMGTHGRRGWRRALLGSVTEQVVHQSETAVMSVPALKRDGEPKIRTILCPVNFTTIGRKALDQAVSLAQGFDAELLVVHVADLLDEPFLSHLEEDFAAWIEPGIRSRCRYSQIISRGDAPEQVVAIAESSNADLIVVGAQHRRFTDTTVIGPTTERILRFAKRPVLTVFSPLPAVKHEAESPAVTSAKR